MVVVMHVDLLGLPGGIQNPTDRGGKLSRIPSPFIANKCNGYYHDQQDNQRSDHGEYREICVEETAVLKYREYREMCVEETAELKYREYREICVEETAELKYG